MYELQVINDERFQIFSKENLGSVRTIFANNQVWFCIKDVCDILELTNPTVVAKRLDEDEKAKFDLGLKNGELTNFTNESGLYTLILRSDKKEAKPFRKWITSEVIPAIRKTGMYMTDDVWNSIMNEPEKIGELLINYGKVRHENENLKFANKVQEQQIIELQPKALYYDLILQCKDLLSTTMIAKDYGMAAKGFNKMLHEFGIQYNQSGVWFLYQKYAIYGYTQTKTNAFVRSDGTPDGKPHMYWTQKGRIFLYNFLKDKGVLPTIEQEEVGA
nr:MAG TPA: repressor domain protein [Caudoviricetes sp.]